MLWIALYPQICDSLDNQFWIKKYHICHQDKFTKKKFVCAVITFNTNFINILKQFNPENIVSKDSEYLQGVGKLENSIHWFNEYISPAYYHPNWVLVWPCWAPTYLSILTQFSSLQICPITTWIKCQDWRPLKNKFWLFLHSLTIIKVGTTVQF